MTVQLATRTDEQLARLAATHALPGIRVVAERILRERTARSADMHAGEA